MNNSENEKFNTFLEKLSGINNSALEKSEISQNFTKVSYQEDIAPFPFQFKQEGTLSSMLPAFNEDILVDEDKGNVLTDYNVLLQSNQSIVAFLNTASTIRVNSILNIKYFRDVNYHDCPVFDLKKCQSDPNLFASVDIEGNLFVWKIVYNESGQAFEILPKLQSTMGSGKKIIVWKSEILLSTWSEKSVEFWTISNEESTSLEGVIQAPDKYEMRQFQSTILDLSFSKKNNLFYLAFENGTLGIFNSESFTKIKDFEPFPLQKCIRVFGFTDIFKERIGPGLKDIFITISDTYKAKVWDLNQWNEEIQQYSCIQEIDILCAKNKNNSLEEMKKIEFIWNDKMDLLFVWKSLKSNKNLMTIFHVSSEYIEGNDPLSSINSDFFAGRKEIGLPSDSTLFSLDFICYPELQFEMYFQNEFKESLFANSILSQMTKIPTMLGIFGLSAKNIRIFILSKENAISLEKNANIYFEFSPKNKPLSNLPPPNLTSNKEEIQSNGGPENRINQLDNNGHMNSNQNYSNNIKKSNNFFEEQKNDQGSQKKEVKILQRKPKSKNDESSCKEEKNTQISQGSQKPNKQNESVTPEKKEIPEIKQTIPKNPKPMKIYSEKTEINSKGDKIESPNYIYEPKAEAANLEAATLNNFEGLFEKLEKRFISRFDRIESKLLQTQSNIKAQKIDIPLSQPNFNFLNEPAFQSTLKREIENSVKKEIEASIRKEFQNQFENTVTPCIEKYMISMNDQISKTYEKGHKYYLEKMNSEQIKNVQIKESLKETLGIYNRISHLLQENICSSQKNIIQMNNGLVDKSLQLNKVIDQMNEIQEMEVSLMRKMDDITKTFSDILGRGKLNESGIEIERRVDKTQSEINDLNILQGLGGGYARPGIESNANEILNSLSGGNQIDNNALINHILSQNGSSSLAHMLRSLQLREFYPDYGNMPNEEIDPNLNYINHQSPMNRQMQGASQLYQNHLSQQPRPQRVNPNILQYPPNLPHPNVNPYSQHQIPQNPPIYSQPNISLHNPSLTPQQVSNNENILNHLNSTNIQTMMQMMIQNWKDAQSKEISSSKSINSSRINEDNC